MKNTHRLFASVILAVAATAALMAQAPPASARVATTRTAPDEFGTQDYVVTTIQCSAFTTDSTSRMAAFYFCSFLQTDPPNVGGHLFTGVEVPSGAVIDFVGMQTCGSDPGLTATLFSVDRYSGTTSGIVSVPSSGGSCHTEYNAAPLGWQLVANAHNALVLDVYQPDGMNNPPSFYWVEIWWKRAVSPPPATPTFGDVAIGDFGYQYIEALSASGVTGGCGNGDYCPDRNVTRREMAIFLSKALGLHWPN